MNSSITSQSYLLNIIKDRYFCSSKKNFIHYGDCDIYQANRPFCSCGLIYQLNQIDYDLASIIYPKYANDSYLQDHGKRRRISKKEEAENQKFLESIFGKFNSPSFEEVKYDYNFYEKVLFNCFRKKEFPGAFSRLNKWVREQVNK